MNLLIGSPQINIATVLQGNTQQAVNVAGATLLQQTGQLGVNASTVSQGNFVL